MLLHAFAVLLQVTVATPAPGRCVGAPLPFPVKVARPAPVPQNAVALQKIARSATRGKLGCGQGVVTLCTRSGVVSRETTFDVLHVFGSAVEVQDLVGLLISRQEANRTGRGPMSGDRIDLLVITLQAVGLAAAPETLEPLIATLEDPEIEVRRGTARLSSRWANPILQFGPASARRAFDDQGDLQLLLPSWLTHGA